MYPEVDLISILPSFSESSSSNPLLEFCLDGGLGDKKPQPRLPQQHYSSAFSTLWSSSSSAAESFEKSPNQQPQPLSKKEDDSALQLALLLNPLLRICSKTPFGREESEELKAILGVNGEGGDSNNKLIGCDNKQIHATGPKGRTAMHFLISGKPKPDVSCANLPKTALQGGLRILFKLFGLHPATPVSIALRAKGCNLTDKTMHLCLGFAICLDPSLPPSAE